MIAVVIEPIGEQEESAAVAKSSWPERRQGLNEGVEQGSHVAVWKEDDRVSIFVPEVDEGKVVSSEASECWRSHSAAARSIGSPGSMESLTSVRTRMETGSE